MNDEELKQLWQQQPLRMPVSGAHLLSIVQKQTSRLRRIVKARDLRELIACASIIIIFGIFYFTVYRNPVARLGDLIVIGGAIFIAWKLVYTRRSTPPAPSGASIVESLRAELNAVQAQSRLLGSVMWWYILPLTVGELLIVDSRRGNLHSTTMAGLMILGINGLVYRLNRWARSRQLLPLEKQLQSLVHSAETGEPLDEPLAALAEVPRISLTESVHPVEFKVDFWQLAVWGEIGFVGIWFFGSLGLTFFNLPKMFTPACLVWAVPFVLGGLVYAWLLQKLTKRAVGISPLGVHLRKGRNLILWEEIKEIRPLKVLNIRSLWLIKESGEKTILPWTGLERQADLKAAVKKFAPANHPIRNYLSLLRTGLRKNIMKIIVIGIVLFSLGAIVVVCAKESKSPVLEYTDPVAQMLERIREKHDLPALAAAVIVDGRIVSSNAVGFRKNGSPEKVTVNDEFHLGSVTKSMTATVAAMLVEQGRISWTTTIGQALPNLKSEIHPGYLNVTLEQLLSHRGGAPGDAPGDLWSEAWGATGTPGEQRMAFVKGLLARKPEAKPGTKYIYSNQGYAIAGVMLEKATGKTWEDLLRTMLFEPLGMTTVGFGAPASEGKIDQPWGHTKNILSGEEPVPPGPGADNPLAISPAGAVHCSVGDLAKYAAFHMAGERGESKLLSAKSFKKLHTAIPDNENYALGWIVLKRSWAKGRALMHNGSNTMFYVVIWMAPDRNCAVIVASNVGVDEAFQGCDEAAGNLIEQFFPE